MDHTRQDASATSYRPTLACANPTQTPFGPNLSLHSLSLRSPSIPIPSLSTPLPMSSTGSASGGGSSCEDDLVD